MLIAVGRLNGSIRNQRLFYSSYELQTKIVKAQHYKQLGTVNRHGMPQENMLRHLSVYWDLNLSCNISRPCSSHSWGHNHRLWCNCSSTLAVLVSLLPAESRRSSSAFLHHTLIERGTKTPCQPAIHVSLAPHIISSVSSPSTCGRNGMEYFYSRRQTY